MKTNNKAAILLIVFAVGAACAFSAAAQTQYLRYSVPAAVSKLAPISRLPEGTNLHLAIGLPLRNQAALTNLLQQLYDPSSKNYRHYLTPEQFTEQFGPTDADYQAVAAFAKSHGLAVTGTHPNRVILDVSGAPSAIESALHVNLNVYQHPTENRTFYAPDRAPSLDLAVPVSGVSGLDNYSLPHPNVTATPLAATQNPPPRTGSGPNGFFTGNDFRAAYLPYTTLTGAGQAVGLLEFDGYSAGDIAYYESTNELPNVTLDNVLLDGFDGNPVSPGSFLNAEVCMDIENAIAMAPGLSKVIVYMAGNLGNWADILNRMATDDQAKQLSCSWLMEGPSDGSYEPIFQEMAAQGQSFFAASGDSNAYTVPIPFPCNSPNITIVGGTTLTTTSPGGSWASETVWNREAEFGTNFDGIGSGGGISTQYVIPGWQRGVSTAANQGSATLRNIPDVALTAENIYVRVDGQDYRGHGTSSAAPLWAAVTSLINEQELADGLPTVGFLNPTLYAIAESSNYFSAFHDITTGNNEWSNSPNKYSAVPGYDLCTGLGTPNSNLINNFQASCSPQVVPIGFSGNSFQLLINDDIDSQVAVQASDDFQSWTSLGTVTLNEGTATFSDSSASLFTHRFYQVTGSCKTSASEGFVTVTVPGQSSSGTGGLALIANQLNNPGGNTIGVLLPSVPNGTVVKKLVANNYTINTFSATSGWSIPGMTLNPGEGAFVQNPTTTPLTLTFVGYVPAAPQSVAIPSSGSWSLVSSPLPVSAGLDVLGFPTSEGEAVLRFNPVSQQYLTPDLYAATLDDGLGFTGWYNNSTGNPEVPVPQVGEAFFVADSSGQPWNETFPSFGLTDTGFLSGGGFFFTINDATDANVTIQATGNFQTWTTLVTAPLDAGTQTFLDASVNSSTPYRFYRVTNSAGTVLPDTVGFVNMSVPARSAGGTGGYAAVANQLDNRGGNLLGALLPSVPVGTTVEKYAPGQSPYATTATFTATGWDNPGMTLNPGEGAFVQNPTTTPFTLTFVGHVPMGAQNLIIPAPEQWALVSSPLPVSSGPSALTFLPAADGEQVMRYDASSQQYLTPDSYAATLGDGLGFIGWYNNNTGNPEVPDPQVGEAFFIWNTSGGIQTWPEIPLVQ